MTWSTVKPTSSLNKLLVKQEIVPITSPAKKRKKIREARFPQYGATTEVREGEKGQKKNVS